MKSSSVCEQRDTTKMAEQREGEEKGERKGRDGANALEW